MSRRKTAQVGSLDLLLDTVCNTFGSLIFLALLVSVLLSRTSRTPTPDQVGTRPAVGPADITRLRGKMDRMEAAAEDLQRVLEDHRITISRVSSAEIVALIDELKLLQSRADGHEAAQARLLMEIAETQAMTAVARAAALKARQDMEHAGTHAARARSELEDATRQRDRLARNRDRVRAAAAGVTARVTYAAPRERTTSKEEFGVLLRYGRMYLMHRNVGETREINSEDFLIVPGSLSNEARARPAAGTPLAGAEAAGAVAARLLPYPPTTWYPCVIVHPDSFEEFQVFKALLVSNGYEYRLMPTDSVVTDAGRVDARVQ